MENAILLKYGFTGLKWLAPLLIKFLNNKTRNALLKKVRTKQNRMSVILMSKKGGKTTLCNYLTELENNNSLFFDLDDSSLLRSSYNYTNMLKALDGNVNEILLLPEVLKIVNELRANFKNKNIFLFTSNFELAKYLSENDVELLTFVMNKKLFETTFESLENETDKKAFLNSFIKLTKLNNYKTYESFDELKAICKNLFIN
jgi:hypothetical protein